MLKPAEVSCVLSKAAERSAPPSANDSTRIPIFLSFGFRDCVSFQAKSNANYENSAGRRIQQSA